MSYISKQTEEVITNREIELVSSRGATYEWNKVETKGNRFEGKKSFQVQVFFFLYLLRTTVISSQ
jgi:hypothetical protein